MTPTKSVYRTVAEWYAGVDGSAAASCCGHQNSQHVLTLRRGKVLAIKCHHYNPQEGRPCQCRGWSDRDKGAQS